MPTNMERDNNKKKRYIFENLFLTKISARTSRNNNKDKTLINTKCPGTIDKHNNNNNLRCDGTWFLRTYQYQS